ncbi:Serine/threonine-protein kinase 24 [Fukomys damarensis]|uniref:Serine/threonine-protein kinase 24 n=1 Tax=Fukomys damarensis TaxID=885580 RepID=A0A091DPQ2_FUKDA|nr:Serine/threonine-protein kinase 24 [Fukomys damarensis]
MKGNVEGLDDLRSKKIHRDIEAADVLLSAHAEGKLADLGSKPPTLEGNDEKALKESWRPVWVRSGAVDRPTAKQLLKQRPDRAHRQAQRWKAEQSHCHSEAETDGQGSGGSDSGHWICTCREKGPKKLLLQPSELERSKMKGVPRGLSLSVYRHLWLLFAELKEKSQGGWGPGVQRRAGEEACRAPATPARGRLQSL